MVRTAAWVPFFCAFAWMGAFSLPAKDAAAHPPGDVATEDIVTPVALDVIEPGASLQPMTALRRAPVVFRTCPGAFAAAAGALTSAFDHAHSNFLAAIRNAYHRSVLDASTVASAGFGNLVATFNLKSPDFPVATDLARHWACGDKDLAARDAMIQLLLQTMRHAVRADKLPAGFVLGDTAWLVNAGGSGKKLTLQEVNQRGRQVPQTDIITLARLRDFFCRGFPPDDQLTARALAAFLRPTCKLDVGLTQQACAAAVGETVVIAHYDAGQVVVRRGQVADAAVKTVLDELSRKTARGGFASLPVAGRAPVGPSRVPAQPRQRSWAPVERQSPPDASLALLKARENVAWTMVVLAGISMTALLIFWRQWRRQHAPIVVELPSQERVALQSGARPHATRMAGEVGARELRLERHNLLQAQQAAIMELARLTRRLDESRTPLVERLWAYETRIGELEQELADRTKENRELLQSRIEILRRQLAVERAVQPVEFN